ncbi:MAG: SatD family protein [Bacteroidetes bacterium]|nr:SatD family protein [Bacteroidota bacterium]MBU1372561.1 SatD family protein [Bacteroidota bacterium]MBU1485030.1 SatD family protein [Bacteroidota bacterium]MBU2045986.1 SatD family protein [Bacteroidota bacterium]MBU2269317.1 SatD family protein [Bacteroidota bacterium]
MKDYIILMADIIRSGDKNQKKLMLNFKKLIDEVNDENKSLMLSPMTITLGDEFQGIASNIQSATRLLFLLQEKTLQMGADFKLRYVMVEGAIETPINDKIAYGMMGEGLTKARKLLELSKGDDRNYHIELKDEKKSAALSDSLFLYQSIVDSWNLERDHALVVEFIKLDDYKKVAEKLNKTRSLMWKRRKSLQIDEYFSVKKVINYIAA